MVRVEDAGAGEGEYDEDEEVRRAEGWDRHVRTVSRARKDGARSRVGRSSPFRGKLTATPVGKLSSKAGIGIFSIRFSSWLLFKRAWTERPRRRGDFLPCWARHRGRALPLCLWTRTRSFRAAGSGKAWIDKRNHEIN